VTDDPNNGFLDLADVIRGLRSELEKAIDERDSSGSKIRFRLKPARVTLEAVVKREGGIEGKVKWYVIEAGASGKLASEVTQKLELELEPLEVDAAGQKAQLEVGSSRPPGKNMAD
jgi:hypothetical protein